MISLAHSGQKAMVFILHLKIDLKITIKNPEEVVGATYHKLCLLFSLNSLSFRYLTRTPFIYHKTLSILPPFHVCVPWKVKGERFVVLLLNYPSTKQTIYPYEYVNFLALMLFIIVNVCIYFYLAQEY